MADYLKIPEVARRLDVSEPTVRRMVKGGKLPSVFVGGAYRVREADLEEYLENAKVVPGKALAPPSPGPSERAALSEEWRLRMLRPIAPAATLLNSFFAPKVDAGDFTEEEYERVGKTFDDLQRTMADAMSYEHMHSEEGASEAELEAFNPAWQGCYALQNTLQRAYKVLDARGVTNIREVREMRTG